MTNIIELKAEEQMIAAVEQHPNVRDILNMVLYAFGKWGNIKGLRVDKDYVRLNRICLRRSLGNFRWNRSMDRNISASIKIKSV